MQNRNFLSRVISDVLAPEAWTRTKDHWYRVTDDLILVLTLQKKFQFSGKFTITLGIFIRPDAKDESVRNSSDYLSFRAYIDQYYNFLRDYPNGRLPKDNHCDLRTDLARLVPDADRLASALNLENSSITEAERAHTIATCLHDYGLSFFQQARSLNALRDLYRRGVITFPLWLIPERIARFLADTPHQQL